MATGLIPTKPLRSRLCRACREQFTPARQMQRVCSPECARLDAEAVRVKRERKADAEKRRSLKKWRELVAETQEMCNRYVRLRDAGKPCISCGRHHTGQWHAGHFRSTAAAPELRFNLHNIHAQCAPCNVHLSGNLINYRMGLIDRIGLAAVEALEGPHDTAKPTREELVEMRRGFLAMARELKR